MHIVFIHGANATRDSWNFIADRLLSKLNGVIEVTDTVFLQYKSDNGFSANVIDMITELGELDEMFIVAHSLGGVYALHLMDVFGSNVKGVVSISTPFGGIESAFLLSMIKPCQLYRDVHTTSTPIVTGSHIELSCPWTQLVTTRGHSHLMNEPNDGVVTLRSMRKRTDVRYLQVESCHYEVMLRPDTVDMIVEEMIYSMEFWRRRET